jgi:hypothetical protein
MDKENVLDSKNKILFCGGNKGIQSVRQVYKSEDIILNAII